MRRHRTSLGDTAVPAAAAPSGTPVVTTSCMNVCKPAPTIWTHLDHIGTVASAITAAGIVWALLHGKRAL